MNAKILKVSVMIPTYNQAHLICRAIESALSQSYRNIEIIISDDCSSDNTQKVVTDIINANPGRGLYYSQNSENLGILRNYYNALLRTTGDLVINLDGDDFFINPSYIEQAVALFEANSDIVLVFGDYCEYNEHTKEKLDVRNKQLSEVMSDHFFYSTFAEGKITWNHNTIIYKRQPAIELGFYWDPIIPRNDWESFLRLIAGHKVGYLPDIQAAWVQHDCNETGRLDTDKYLTNYALIEGIASYAQQYFEKNYIRKWQNKMIWFKTKSSATSYLIRRDPKGLIRFLLAASKVQSNLPLRAATSPDLILRAVISINPRLYKCIKHIYRRVSSRS